MPYIIIIIIVIIVVVFIIIITIIKSALKQRHSGRWTRVKIQTVRRLPLKIWTSKGSIFRWEHSDICKLSNSLSISLLSKRFCAVQEQRITGR